MRKIDIKFDGIKKKDGYWVYGDGCLCENGHVYILVKNRFGVFSDVEIRPLSLRVKILEHNAKLNSVCNYKVDISNKKEGIVCDRTFHTNGI